MIKPFVLFHPIIVIYVLFSSISFYNLFKYINSYNNEIINKYKDMYSQILKITIIDKDTSYNHLTITDKTKNSYVIYTKCDQQQDKCDLIYNIINIGDEYNIIYTSSWININGDYFEILNNNKYNFIIQLNNSDNSVLVNKDYVLL